jgi:hypothetical protein
VTDLTALAAEVRGTRQGLDRRYGRAQQVVKAGRAAEAEIAALEEHSAVCARTSAVLTRIGEEAQEEARAKFEALATQALQSVFGEGLTFHLVPGETGGQVTLEPVIRSEFAGEMIETGIMDARGGGMGAVVGFVLRLVKILLSPGVADIVFLDEPFGFVSESYSDALGTFLAGVARLTGVQVVMITHDKTFGQYADSRVRMSLGAGRETVVQAGESE